MVHIQDHYKGPDYQKNILNWLLHHTGKQVQTIYSTQYSRIREMSCMLNDAKLAILCINVYTYACTYV